MLVLYFFARLLERRATMREAFTGIVISYLVLCVMYFCDDLTLLRLIMERPLFLQGAFLWGLLLEAFTIYLHPSKFSYYVFQSLRHSK